MEAIHPGPDGSSSSRLRHRTDEGEESRLLASPLAEAMEGKGVAW